MPTGTKPITQVGTNPVSSCLDTDEFVMIVGGHTKRMSMAAVRSQMNQNQQQYLEQNAFFIEENTPSSRGAAYCDTGGNQLMLQAWLSRITNILLSKDGYAVRLSKTDNRYTEDGDKVVEAGAVVSAYANADWFGMFEGTYWNYLQSYVNGNKTYYRHWISLNPIPGGWEERNNCWATFKIYVINNVARSIPFVVPTSTKTINAFFTAAQARSKNHGLAGAPFRNFLLAYTLGKYGYRDIQNLRGGDGTVIFGTSLDGSENPTSDAASGFDRQKNIATGATLALGTADGKAEVTDSAGGTVHVARVAAWEGVYGQYWEMDGHQCSVGSKVFMWRGNFMPPSAPTEEMFASIDHDEFTRATTSEMDYWEINLNTTVGKQAMSYAPKQSNSGISYGDHYWYAAAGQLWMVGGSSSNGSHCGGGCSYSDDVWSNSNAHFSARLDFHGDVHFVTSTEFKRILAAA